MALWSKAAKGLLYDQKDVLQFSTSNKKGSLDFMTANDKNKK